MNSNRHSRLLVAAALLCLGIPARAIAAVTGTNVPAAPVTAERVAGLAAWKAYLGHSERMRQADQDAFRAELLVHGLRRSTEPRPGRNAGGANLDHPPKWYAGSEAQRIADNLVSFQTPAGGWCKNTDFAKRRRIPGEIFGAQTGSLFLGANDFDTGKDAQWSCVGTFDNDATTTQLRFLAKVISVSKTRLPDWETSFRRGLDYILAAQYPNGGWPQVWPLQGGYHDAITFNDNAMLHVVEFLRDVAGGQAEFSFLPAEARAKAEASWKRGLDCILKAQIVANGTRTVWCQQHDALTLAPTSARNYEMPAQASSESAEIVLFLMRISQPDPSIVTSIHAACAWFEKTKIVGKQFTGAGRDGKTLVDLPGAGPIWSRYYEIGTDRPIYGDRDKSIHDDVNEISRERRKGYAWFQDRPKRVLQHYALWANAHPQR